MAIFFDLSKMAAVCILDLWCVFSDHPRRAFGGLYHCAKFWLESIQCSCGSFNTLRVIGLKTLIHAPPPNWGPPRKGELVPHLTQCHMGRGIPPYQVLSWSIQLFGTIDMGRDTEAASVNGESGRRGCCAPFRGHSVVWAEAYTSVLSGILLIHSTVWPQYTNFTDRTDRQDNGPIA